MKKVLCLMLCTLLLAGCSNTVTEVSPVETTLETTSVSPAIPAETYPAPEYVSRFQNVTEILLSDEGITVDGGQETSAVFTTHDITYYEDKETYVSGNPYGEGSPDERHTSEEADAHTVINITQPGAYRISGTLSAGQIRVDLGVDCYYNEEAVVELILQDANITCTVAPAILFLNIYECDGNWSTDTAKPDVDTAAAGANLILEGSNTVSGSHVAKIFKDKEGEKKLWKQDGAIYSYMSMNVFGPGSLDLTADNEGLDTELHLTMNGGDIRIFSDNDGINTNEDGVSVTTINGGSLSIYAGLGAEGDGIDSNGYLVINGGTVIASANPMADAGLDSDLGSFIHGGTVLAFGSTMDWAESDSRQVAMNLQFASRQEAGSRIIVTRQDGTELFSYESHSEFDRSFSGVILSHPSFAQGDTYHLYVNGKQMSYTGTDVGFGPGGFGGMGPGKMPGNFNPEEMPEGFDPGNLPEGGFGRGDLPEGFNPDNLPEGFNPDNLPEGGFGPGELPDGFDFGTMPDGGFDRGERPEGFNPGEMPEGGFGNRGERPQQAEGEASVDFYINDMVNCFSGIQAL